MRATVEWGKAPLGPGVSGTVEVSMVKRFIAPRGATTVPRTTRVSKRDPDRFPVVRPGMTPVRGRKAVSPPQGPTHVIGTIDADFRGGSENLTYPSSATFSVDSTPTPVWSRIPEDGMVPVAERSPAVAHACKFLGRLPCTPTAPFDAVRGAVLVATRPATVTPVFGPISVIDFKVSAA